MTTPKKPSDTPPKERPLYITNGGKNPGPVSFEQLNDVLRETIYVMDGCKSLIESLQDINRWFEFRGPLIMLRETLDYGIDNLSTVMTDEVMPEVAK